jgi:hypothetical protein
MLVNSPSIGHGEWDIVPDPSSDGGFRLVESLSGNMDPAELPHQGSSSSILYGNGNSSQGNGGTNNRRSPNILGTGMASGATITLGVSSAAGSELPSKNILSSGMTSAAVVGTGVSTGSRYQRPSVSVLGEGVSLVVGDDSSTKVIGVYLTKTGTSPQAVSLIHYMLLKMTVVQGLHHHPRLVGEFHHSSSHSHSFFQLHIGIRLQSV